LAARADRLSANFEDAEAHLQKCLKLQHGATEDIQLEYLLMRVQRGQEEEAARDLIHYVDNKHPETPLILETLSRASMYHLRYGPALFWLDRWIKVEPDSAKPYQWRAWVLERVNDFEGAMSDYQKALDLAPDSFETRFRVAEIYLERSNPPAAIEHLEWLRKGFPDRPVVTARLGQCFYLEGEVEKARPLLEAAVENLPDDVLLLLTLAKLELQEDRPAEAERWLRHLLQVDPYDQEAEYALFTSLQTQGRLQEASAVLDKWKKDKAQFEKANMLLKEEAKETSRDPNTAYEIGAALLNVGQDRMGLYWLNQALERNGAYQPALKALVDYYEKKGDSKTAMAYRRKITEPDKKIDSP
jgi:tetratricopeptide (TPR) repeat protein